jgi:hypothetical protein
VTGFDVLFGDSAVLVAAATAILACVVYPPGESEFQPSAGPA